MHHDRLFMLKLPTLPILLALASPLAAAETALSPQAARDAVGPHAARVLDLLVKRDFKGLSGFVGAKGLTLSPFVSLLDDNVRLSRAEVEGCAADGRLRVFGVDATDRKIRLACADYFKRYVRAALFAKADEVLFNERRDRGVDVNNSHELVPGGTVVEYHLKAVPGAKNPPWEWESLRLIFAPAPVGTRPDLVAVTRDVFTP